MPTQAPSADLLRGDGMVNSLLQVYLIRHGETAWSLSGQHTGNTDLPLTAHGEDAARQLGTTLQGLAFSRVFTSPRQRARCTCELAGLGAAAQTEADLSEWDYGDYEGLRTVDIQKLHPHWDVLKDGCPGGELPADVGGRADRVIARLRHCTGRVALFSHGQFGRVLVARWIGLPPLQGQHFAVDPASVGILGYASAHPQHRIISLWNAAAGTPLYA
jgi:broad specificity phosphatase PhoE